MVRHTRERFTQRSLAPAAAMTASTMDVPIAYTDFTDGDRRPVYEDARRRFVIDEEGMRVSGVWFIPREDCDFPITVTTS